MAVADRVCGELCRESEVCDAGVFLQRIRDGGDPMVLPLNGNWVV